MRPITEVLHDGVWKGKRAFVVGSGPSIKDLDLQSLLAGELSIGCNEEYLWHPTIALCQDPRIFHYGLGRRLPFAENPDWYGGPHLPVYFKGHPDRPDWPAPNTVYQVQSCHSQDEPFKWGTSLVTGLYYGANVGMAAINLAEILGARVIYLLGFDANAADQDTHHHQAYPEAWKLSDAQSRRSVYSRWITAFREIAKMVRTRVINLNPGSAIDAFPKGRIRRSPIMWDIECETQQ